jgi:hypothetical protein
MGVYRQLASFSDPTTTRGTMTGPFHDPVYNPPAIALGPVPVAAPANPAPAPVAVAAPAAVVAPVEEVIEEEEVIEYDYDPYAEEVEEEAVEEEEAEEEVAEAEAPEPPALEPALEVEPPALEAPTPKPEPEPETPTPAKRTRKPRATATPPEPKTPRKTTTKEQPAKEQPEHMTPYQERLSEWVSITQRYYGTGGNLNKREECSSLRTQFGKWKKLGSMLAPLELHTLGVLSGIDPMNRTPLQLDAHFRGETVEQAHERVMVAYWGELGRSVPCPEWRLAPILALSEEDLLDKLPFDDDTPVSPRDIADRLEFLGLSRESQALAFDTVVRFSMATMHQRLQDLRQQ